MMRITLPIIVLALLVLAGCSASPGSEAYIKQQIAEANYCETPADCIDVGGKCPFDCYIFVNSSEVDRMKEMVDGYESTCTYSCLAISGVDCVSNRCQPVQQMP